MKTTNLPPELEDLMTHGLVPDEMRYDARSTMDEPDSVESTALALESDTMITSEAGDTSGNGAAFSVSDGYSSCSQSTTDTIFSDTLDSIIEEAICESNSDVPEQTIAKSMCNPSEGNGALRHTADKLKKSRWSAQEDALLTQCVEQYGPKWIEIGEQHFPNRKHEAIRKRWRTIRTDDAKRGCQHQDWTPEEHILLCRLCKVYGANWKFIQAYFPNRSSEAIRNFWKRQLKSNNKSTGQDEMESMMPKVTPAYHPH